MSITTPSQLSQTLQLLQANNLLTVELYNALRRDIWSDTGRTDTTSLEGFYAYCANREAFKPGGRHLELCAKVEALCALV